MFQAGCALGELQSSCPAETLVLWPAAGSLVLQSTRGRDPESIPEASAETKITLGAFAFFLLGMSKTPTNCAPLASSCSTGLESFIFHHSLQPSGGKMIKSLIWEKGWS